MVKLFCAVVGEQGNAFPVDIIASESVGDLKEEIQKKKAQTITDDADKLELFLAKKGNKWLNKEDVAAVKLDEEQHAVIEDENGHPQRFEHMDELSDIVDYFGEGFARKRGDIHVLVVLPNDSKQQEKRQKVEENTIDPMSDQLRSFNDAKLDDECISATTFLPYPKEQIEKVFVRKCYKDIFDLFLEKIKDRVELQKPRTPIDFGISGTPGIGKSLFFVYILYRLVHTQCPYFKPKRIVYQTAADFKVFDLETYTVSVIDQLGVPNLLYDPETFYIIDGRDPVYVNGSCVVMFIASPRSDNYKEFVKQKNAQQWFLPVWTLDELEACRERCYPDFRIDTLNEQYRIYGGAARSVFHSNGSEDMEASLADADAVNSVRNFGHPTRIFRTAHMLLHVIVSDDGNYKFKHVDIASKYVGEQLWKKHAAQMVKNLREMFGGSPNEISRHLFEIYGHLFFSQGGRKLRCRNLDDDSTSELYLDGFDGNRESFTRNSIPKKPITHYYEPSDDDTFPAIDSLSPQGMFQFTVGTEHPIRGVQILQEVCKAFDKPYKLYFVVPPHRFEKFTKQPFKARKGNDAVKPIEDLEQYALELAIEES